jgi:hypothetical protein
VDRTEPEFRLIPLDRCEIYPSWKGTVLTFWDSLRVKCCTSTCSSAYNTYDEGFTYPSSHDPSCHDVYIVAPEQEVRSYGRESKSLKPNQCLQSLTGDTSWKGPVIAFAENTKSKHVDIGTSVFNKILREFCSIAGVRINCDGVVKEHNAPRFEAVTIESHDLICNSFAWRGDYPHYKTALTLHTGMVLLATKESHWRRPKLSYTDSKNSISKLLSIPCDISKHNFGCYERAAGTGNVIVIREDRKPLDVKYTEILCGWILNVLRPLFKQVRADCTQITRQGLKGRPRTREHRAIRQKVFKLITKENLLEYAGGRLKDEDPEDSEDAEDEEMVDITENDDTTDEEMPGDGEESEASGEDENMSDDESSDAQDGDSGE